MKYIDADLLRRDIDNWKEAMADAVGEYSDGVRFALEHFTFILDSLQQEQRETDGDDGKFVKILVRKEFAEQLQKLGDEIKAGQSSFIGAMNQQEQPDFPTTDEEVEKFLATHPKVEVPDKYKTPDWLFKKLEQEQPEVDLEKELIHWHEHHFKKTGIYEKYSGFYLENSSQLDLARHFYELGKNSK